MLLQVRFPYIEVGLVMETDTEPIWRLVAEPAQWLRWGPSIRAVDCPDPILGPSSYGRVRTVLGFWVPFRVSRFREGRFWAWDVFGFPATTHRVEPVAPGRTLLAFGTPILAFPYLPVCCAAIRRIAAIVNRTVP